MYQHLSDFDSVGRLEGAVLLFSKDLEARAVGGRELLTKLNECALKNIFGERLFTFKVPSVGPQSIRLKLKFIKGYIDGVDDLVIHSACELIEKENIKIIFVDGSNYGSYVRYVKKNFPFIKVFTFFHNVEARFFWGSWRLHRTIRSFVVLIANYIAERNAVKWSDDILCLSSRDSLLLKKIYGRCASHILPMAMEDTLITEPIESPIITNSPFALFVGGNFYANREGILWFVENVVPLIDMKIVIIGNGMEKIRKQIALPGKVEVIGTVDCLSDWYRHAQFIIAPIFDGSGMKTKVAEALMHGKKIVGTPEAFSGYEEIIESIGWSCKSVSDFVLAFANARATITVSYDPVMRNIYKKYYSPVAAQNRLKRVFYPAT